MRLHGDREPKMPQVGTTGGATCLSGAEWEDLWSHKIYQGGTFVEVTVTLEKIPVFIKRTETMYWKQ